MFKSHPNGLTKPCKLVLDPKKLKRANIANSESKTRLKIPKNDIFK